MAPLAALLFCAGPADARPKIPKELAGVELSDHVLAAKVDRKAPKKVGGREVIAFTERVLWDEVEEHRLYVIADRDSKVTLFQVDLGEQEASWKDYDGDGEPELRLTGADQPMHVFQMRYGELVEVGVNAAVCGRSANDTLGFSDDDAPGLRDEAVAKFLTDLDYGASEKVLRCDFADALAARPAQTGPVEVPWPESGGSFTMSPVALDCPANDWMARHGMVANPVRVGTYITADDRVALIRIDEIGVRVTVPYEERTVWAQSWILDDRLYVMGERRETKRWRDWFVLDVVEGKEVGGGPLRQDESAALQVGTSGAGVFELVTTAAEPRTLWRKEVRTWHL